MFFFFLGLFIYPLYFSDNAVKCSVYHAELPLKQRNEVHDKFVKDEIQVIAATVAFGMGIDKPGIYYLLEL